jgi:hypothetical protein
VEVEKEVEKEEEPNIMSATAAPPPDDAPALRADVEGICKHLADRIEANGSKRPTTTAQWRTSARLMLDKDGRSEQDVHAAIDWCQNNEFWRSNVMSLPKLREKFDTMRLQASRPVPMHAANSNTVHLSAAMERARARDAADDAARAEINDQPLRKAITA